MIRRHHLLRFVAAAGLLATAACASSNNNVDRLAAADPTPSFVPVPAGAQPPGVPATNWDAPQVDGVATTAKDAPGRGRLSFTPRVPNFAASLTLVQVTDPAREPSAAHRSVTYVYSFKGDAGFPGDARVRVEEKPTDLTDADLKELAQNPPGRPESFRIVTVGQHVALLVQDDAAAVGRVMFIVNGVMYDVAGPALSPAQAIRLAARL